MSKLSFASSLQALRGKDHLALFAPKSALKGVWKQVFKGAWNGVVEKLVADAEPGPMGKVLSTYTGVNKPRRVSVAVLPEGGSRHMAPARTAAVQTCAGGLSHGKAKQVTLILCLDEAEHYLAAVTGLARTLPLFSARSKPSASPAITVLAVDRKGAVIKPSAEVKAAGTYVRWAAELVDTPTAELHAESFVKRVKAELKGKKGLKTTTIVGNDLLKKGLGGIHGVGRTAKVAPRLLIVERGPKKAKRTIALVGKGVVYDTGGLNIKVGAGMSGMKCDMGGAAAVSGAFMSLLSSRLPGTRLCLVVPLAENAIGPDSYRPDDILTLHSGKTVEINNTDAEGRLLLADAVSYAARVLKADVVIDAATLTGAQLLATGKRHAAVVSNREGLEDLAVESGRASGDLTHPLPFAPAFFQAEFKSTVADMRNSVKDRMNAQTSCAGQFVYSHIQDTDAAWLHVDLAGPAFPTKRATGFGVSLLAELVRRMQPHHLES